MNTSVTSATSQSTQVIASPDKSPPMDVDQHNSHTETHTCYNCHKVGHIAPNCPKPRKQRIRNNAIDVDISDLVAKAVTAALDARDKKGEAMEAVKRDF